jgi:hypothetical protein
MEWINISDRLPTEDELNRFDIIVEHYRGDRQFYNSIKMEVGELEFWFDHDYWLEVKNAVRWLAIPEPEESK